MVQNNVYHFTTTSSHGCTGLTKIPKILNFNMDICTVCAEIWSKVAYSELHRVTKWLQHYDTPRGIDALRFRHSVFLIPLKDQLCKCMAQLKQFASSGYHMIFNKTNHRCMHIKQNKIWLDQTETVNAFHGSRFSIKPPEAHRTVHALVSLVDMLAVVPVISRTWNTP